MNYRPAIKSDIDKIDILCAKENIATPKKGLCFVAEEDGKIIGFINAEARMIIEPMICHDPRVTNVLFNAMQCHLAANGVEEVYLTPHTDKLATEGEKVGFTIIDKGMFLLKKELAHG